MQIGELLKEYRVTKGLTQAQFARNIISRSYYSKVEKNEHRITAEDLIDLLEQNNISLWSFLKKLSLKSDLQHGHQNNLEEEVMQAYYQANRPKLEQLKKQSANSSLSSEEEKLIVAGWIECMKGSEEAPDIKLREDLKNKVFNIPFLDLNKLNLFCNFMEFYDLESNFIITKQALNKYLDTTDSNIQELLLGIIGNLIYLSIKGNNYSYVDYLLQSANKISTKPKLLFAKEVIALYKNLIAYRQKKEKDSLATCKAIIASFKAAGMEAYSRTLNAVLIKYSKN
ncbi:Rgg/GadR/MutR family transcriptional activator [Lactobacillus colini]|uniref:Rgg/GadR/MutR family transcriptional activator n=1 Tax=Lactobacillus colini TaxID=1819254 RepID=A0ABS4MGB6_9LACO|nr:Rgg/GadR/MutR family transcriptional regulator [Lactobacillus colini]MBP2058740.1 Rgg/GadR/MutR family transcriptional activator [Lactobacillus colini]